MSKFICSTCGYVHEGNEAPKRCPVCKSPSSQFSLVEDKDDSGKKDVARTDNDKGIKELQVIEDNQYNNQKVVVVEKDANNVDSGVSVEDSLIKIAETKGINYAIKWYKENSKCDTYEAIERVKSICSQHKMYCTLEDENEILKFGAAKLQAIKWYQEKHNCDLKEAKDIVDSVYANNEEQSANIIENEKVHSSEEKSNGFSSIQKFVFGVLIVFLLFVIFGSLSDGMLLAAFVSSCFLAIIICLLLGKIDKKYAWISIIAAIIIPLLSVGLSADNQEQKESGTEVSSQKEAVEEGQKTDTEQKAETRDINNKTKETNKLSSKEQEIADAGYKKGSMAGYAAAENEEYSNMLDLADQIDGMEDKVNEMIEQMASQQYELEFNAPSNLEEEKLKELYIEHFKKGMDDTMDAMGGLGKKGGNR